ncbi:MAG: MFS transporter [Dehalococcoidia bacterium]|nr:MFS transporter [Dehalococcoidia bacterium]
MKIPARSGERLFTANFILLWAASFTTFASFHILLPIFPLYIVSIGGTESQTGLVIGVLTITSVLTRPWIGLETDRLGKKRILLWGTLALVIAAFSYTLAATLVLLLLLRLFHGIAWAATTTPANALVADIAPVSRMGEAMGYFGTASNLAMAVGPLLGVALVSAFSFNSVFLVASGLALAALAIITRIREPGRIAPAVSSPNMAPARPASQDLIYRPAIFPSFTIFTMTLTFGSLVTFLPLLAFRNNVNPGIFFTVYAIFLIISRPLGGKLADLAGRNAAVIPGMVALALGIGLLAFARDLPLFLLAGALNGIGFSFVNPALMAMTVDRAAPESRGAAMGTFSAAFDLGIGLGAILFGLLLERTSFEVLYLTSAGVAIISMIIYIVIESRGR